MTTQTAKHQPVMLDEVLEALQVKPNAWYIDATFGRGGHTKALISQEANVIAFDVDQDAITYGHTFFSQEIETGKLILIRENFDKLESTLNQLEKPFQLQGILFDFGTSVDQLTNADRGFSFDSEAPLDMRMDSRLGVTASDLLAVLPEKPLADLFFEYGGEQYSRQIAKAIVTQRKNQKAITTTRELVTLIEKVKSRPRERIHPATKVFQALRIAVNSEVIAIETALPQAWEVLAPGGRIVTIAFHEGEDRPVKQVFQTWEKQAKGQIITKKPIVPRGDEVERNPRSRSAKVRVFEK